MSNFDRNYTFPIDSTPNELMPNQSEKCNYNKNYVRFKTFRKYFCAYSSPKRLWPTGGQKCAPILNNELANAKASLGNETFDL